MHRKIYNCSRKYLSDEVRYKIKSRISHFKNKNSKYLKFIYGTFNAEELKKEILKNINTDFDILMVHSSFDEISRAYKGNISELVNVLLMICKNKTLAMPAFILGNNKINFIQYYKNKPFFDPERAISRMGLISEYFRKQPGVIRSLHPSHSVCVTGPLAEEITSKHHLNSTFGANSPFDIMTKYKTVILGLGVHYYRCLTQVHHVEDIMGDKFPVNFNFETANVNIKSEKEIFEYNLTYKYTPLIRRVDILEKLLTKQELFQWKFHGIPMFRVNASDVSNVLIKFANQGKSLYY